MLFTVLACNCKDFAQGNTRSLIVLLVFRRLFFYIAEQWCNEWFVEIKKKKRHLPHNYPILPHLTPSPPPTPPKILTSQPRKNNPRAYWVLSAIWWKITRPIFFPGKLFNSLCDSGRWKKVHYCPLRGRCLFSIIVIGVSAQHFKYLNVHFVSVKTD